MATAASRSRRRRLNPAYVISNVWTAAGYEGAVPPDLPPDKKDVELRRIPTGKLRDVLNDIGKFVAEQLRRDRARAFMATGPEEIGSVPIPFFWAGCANLAIPRTWDLGHETFMRQEITGTEMWEAWASAPPSVYANEPPAPLRKLLEHYSWVTKGEYDLAGVFIVTPGGFVDKISFSAPHLLANVDDVPELQLSLYCLLFVLRAEGALLPEADIDWGYVHAPDLEDAFAGGAELDDFLVDGEWDPVVVEEVLDDAWYGGDWMEMLVPQPGAQNFMEAIEQSQGPYSCRTQCPVPPTLEQAKALYEKSRGSILRR